MNWENKLKATSFLSLKNKDNETFSYIKLDDAAKIAEMAYNEALDKLKEIYKSESDIVETIKDLKI
jgi:glycerol dehydrogenase-like iron-containing ADH family enzyme